MRRTLILLIWVDDILSIGEKTDVEKIGREIRKELNSKDLGD